MNNQIKLALLGASVVGAFFIFTYLSISITIDLWQTNMLLQALVYMPVTLLAVLSGIVIFYAGRITITISRSE